MLHAVCVGSNVRCRDTHSSRSLHEILLCEEENQQPDPLSFTENVSEETVPLELPAGVEILGYCDLSAIKTSCLYYN